MPTVAVNCRKAPFPYLGKPPVKPRAVPTLVIDRPANLDGAAQGNAVVAGTEGGDLLTTTAPPYCFNRNGRWRGPQGRWQGPADGHQGPHGRRVRHRRGR
jgi:hypothetical protein